MKLLSAECWAGTACALVRKLQRLEKQPSTSTISRQSASEAPLFAIRCCALNPVVMQDPAPQHEAAASVALALEVTALQQAAAAAGQTALQNPEAGPPTVSITSAFMQPPCKQLSLFFTSAGEQVSCRTACLDAS